MRSKADIETEERLRWYIQDPEIRSAIEVWDHSDPFLHLTGLEWIRRYAPEQLQEKEKA